MQERCKLGFFSSAPSRLAMHEVYTKISASLAKIDEPQIKRHKRSSPSTACCSMAFMPICLVFLFWAANAGNTACLSFDCIRFNKTNEDGVHSQVTKIRCRAAQYEFLRAAMKYGGALVYRPQISPDPEGKFPSLKWSLVRQWDICWPDMAGQL